MNFVVLTKCLHRPLLHSWPTKTLGVSLTLSLAYKPAFKPLLCQSHQIVKPLLPSQKQSLLVPRPEQEPISNQQIWKILSKIFKKEYLLLTSIIGTAFITAALNLLTPIYIGNLVSILTSTLQAGVHLSIGQWTHLIGPSSLKLLGIFGLQGVLVSVYTFLVSVIGEKVSKELKWNLLKKMFAQPMAFFDAHHTFHLSSLLSTDIQDFKHNFKLLLSQGIKNGIQLIGSMAYLFHLSFRLSLILSSGLVLGYTFGNLYGLYLRRISKNVKQMDASISSWVGEILTHIRTVRAYANEEIELENYEKQLQLLKQEQNHLSFHIGLFQGINNFLVQSMILVVLSFGGMLVTSGEMTSGQLMTYLVSIQNSQKAMQLLSVLMAQSIKAYTGLQRICQYLLLKDEQNYSDGFQPKALEGKIEFRNLSFNYPTRPEAEIIKDLQLVLQPGKVTALCGESGNGKSTIAALLTRFYEPVEGEILLDDQPLQKINLKWFRKHLGFIHQEPILFADSILANIKYGKPEATEEEVRTAAQLANADDFIMQFPEGYQTKVGERGVSLSGGQKQRIAIARVILKNPNILVFDEATSALDSNCEKVVQEALNRLMQGKTVLVIAHRLSTIQNADQIIVLGKKGKILEQGKHEDLLLKKGFYYQFYQKHLESDSND